MTIVIKIGGSIANSVERIAKDLKSLQEPCILVHGVGPQADELTRKLGKTPRWVTSVQGIRSRYTDKETVEIFNTASSSLNREIVSVLQKNGVKASGLNGAIHAQRKEKIKIIENGRKMLLEGDYTGKITGISREAFEKLLKQNSVPVVGPIALSENGEILNVNADRAAAFIAKELGTEIVLNFSDVPGVYDSNKNVIKRIPAQQLEQKMNEVSGGMVMKLLAAKEAMEFGVKKFIIASGIVENPITKALNGEGTVIER